MPRDDDDHSNSDLEFAKARLTEGLKKCRALVHECRFKLARIKYRGNRDKPLFRWKDRPGDSSDG